MSDAGDAALPQGGNRPNACACLYHVLDDFLTLAVQQLHSQMSAAIKTLQFHPQVDTRHTSKTFLSHSHLQMSCSSLAGAIAYSGSFRAFLTFGRDIFDAHMSKMICEMSPKLQSISAGPLLKKCGKSHNRRDRIKCQRKNARCSPHISSNGITQHAAARCYQVIYVCSRGGRTRGRSDRRGARGRSDRRGGGRIIFSICKIWVVAVEDHGVVDFAAATLEQPLGGGSRHAACLHDVRDAGRERRRGADVAQAEVRDHVCCGEMVNTPLMLRMLRRRIMAAGRLRRQPSFFLPSGR